MPFLSMRLLTLWQLQATTIHTALDDLESFLWVLIWGIVNASKDIEGAMTANKGIELMLDAWSGDMAKNMDKYSIAEYNWKDAVFGDLIQEWLKTFQKTNKETRQLIKHMS